MATTATGPKKGLKTGWDERTMLTNNLTIWRPTGSGAESTSIQSVGSGSASSGGRRAKKDKLAEYSSSTPERKKSQDGMATPPSKAAAAAAIAASGSADSNGKASAPSPTSVILASNFDKEKQKDKKDGTHKTLDQQITDSVNELDRAFLSSKQDLGRQLFLLVQLRTLLLERVQVVDEMAKRNPNMTPTPTPQLPCATITIELMKKNPSNLKFMEECTCLLYLISKLDPTFKKGVARLFKVMDDHPYQLSIQRAATAAIRNVVSANREALSRIAPSIRVVLDSMDRFPDDAKLLHTALELMDFLASSSSTGGGGGGSSSPSQLKAFFVTSGALAHTVSAMTKQFTHVSIQSTAFLVLVHLAMDCDTGSSDNGNGAPPLLYHELLRILPLVLKSMNHHMIHPKIQRHGCALLGNLSAAAAAGIPCTSAMTTTVADNSSGDNATKGRQLFHGTITAQVITTISKAMQGHVDDAKVQEYGSAALYHFFGQCSLPLVNDFVALASSTEQQPPPRQVGFRAGSSPPPPSLDRGASSSRTNLNAPLVGGIGILMAGMYRHCTNVQVVQRGLEVVTRICDRDAEHYGYFISERGLDVILSLAGTHLPKQVEVAQLTCELLKHITRQSLDFQRAVTAKGGIAVLLGIMQRHISRIDVQDPAFACVRNLCTHPDNRLQLAADGGISTLLVTMFVYHADAAIQAYGCDALGRLALEKDNRHVIYKEHGIDAALSAMLEHRVHAGVQDRCVFLLWGISEYGPALQDLRKLWSSALPAATTEGKNSSTANLATLLRETKVPPKKDSLDRLAQLKSRLESTAPPPSSSSSSTTAAASGGGGGGWKEALEKLEAIKSRGEQASGGGWFGRK